MRVVQLRNVWLVVTVSVCLASALCVSAVAQTTIHVPADVPSIPQAIFQAHDGDTVLVSPGTYVGNFTFQGKAITVASTDGPAVTILDAQNVSSGPMFQNGEGPQSVLSGFTITNGMSASEGAGVYIQNASPTIENNIITGNHGCEGIGITADNSSAIIKNNIITNNNPQGCTGVGGGGIKISGPGNAQILNNTITGNQVWGNGGGIELNSTTLVTITSNTIQNNSANGSGGGISIENGSQATIVNNLITGNTGFLGTGIYLIGSFDNQNVLVNNTIALNSSPFSTPNQEQVWITGSQGTQFVNNVIVDGTGSGAVGCGVDQVATFTYNDILSTQPTTPPQTMPPFVGCTDVTGTNGNVSVDPQFVNPAGNDFHLQNTSPVIDVGNNNAPNLPDKDLDGNARIGPGNTTSCVGIVDMGAYEFALTSTGTGFLTGIQDFGTVVVGNSSSPQTVSAFVQGCVQVASVTTTGDFSQTNTCGHAIPSFSSCSIQVTFTPTAGGPRAGSLKIDFGSSGSPVSTNLSGTGLVVSPSASPTSLAFANQLVGTTSAAQTVTISAGGGTTSLQITSVSITGDYTQTNSCVGLPIAAPTCFVNVSFAPIGVGSRPGSMVINTNQGSFTITLGGTGIGPIGQLSPSSLSFGNQLLNTTTAPQAITLTNTGGVPLAIASIVTSGDFAQTNSCPASLDPGTGCVINVTFTPVARGSRTGTLTVNSNSFGAAPTASLSGTGQAILVTPSPASLTFPLTAVNTTSAAQSVTLTNSGDLPVTITGIAIGGDYSQTNTCGTSLDVGASCTFSITFTPAIAGPDNDSLTINGNFGSPVVVALNGPGQVQGASGTLFPAFLVFPNQAVGSTSPAQTLTYTNTGTVAVSINSVAIGFGPFAQTNTCPASLAPGDSCTINITFTPPDTTGQAGVLNVNGTGSALAVLAGSSLAQLVSPTTLDFGHQAINSTSPIQTITLANTTANPINISGWSFPLPFNLVSHCFGTIAVGASCTFDATFAPTSSGSFAGFVEISGNFAGSPAALPIVGKATGIGGSLSPASLTFASQVVGTTSTTQTVTLTNKGAVTLSVNGIQTTGDFAQTNNCPATLLPGANCTITTKFTPTDLGARTGTLSVSSDATVAIPPVALSGTGASPAVGVFSPQSLTFGSVNVGAQSAAQIVTLSNTGNSPLTVGLATSGNFTQTNNCPASLAAGANCSINVVFAPTASGSITGSLTLSSNSTPAPPPVTLSGTGAAPIATYSATSLSFAPQLIGSSSAAQTLTLTNTGTAPLAISSLTISSIGSPDFTQTNNCGSSLAVGANCTINVIFAPLARGARSAALSLASNSVPVAPAVSLSGTGQAIQLNPSTGLITFPGQLLNTTSAPQQIPFTNNGDLPVTINSIAATGDFAETNDCPASLVVGAGCTVTLTFTPTARGTRNGSLSIAGNFTGSAPFLSLKGTGQILQGSVSPTALNFFTQVGTPSAPQTVTLTNNGDLPLSITAIATTVNYAQTNNCGSTLGVGLSCTVSVTFTPTATGLQVGSLTFNTNSSTAVGPVVLDGTGSVVAPTFSPTVLNFAPQVIGTISTAQSVTLTNGNVVAISITAIGTGSDFSQTNNCGSSLAAGASCIVNVSFTPTGRGTRTLSLTVTGAFPGIPTVTLSGVGQAILASASPSSFTFAAAPLNTTSSAQAITFTNTGDTTATITGVSITGDFAQTNNCGTSLAVGASCTVNVTFTPTARGSRTGTLTLQGNFTSPAQVVNLSGNGQAALASFTPASFDFGNVPVNVSSLVQTFFYANTGDLPLNIASVSVPSDFSQTNNCPATLALNTGCTITVTFSPRSTGTQTASLTVSGIVNSSAGLTGTGVMPLATLSPTSLNFGNQRAGTASAPQLVTVTNSGAFPFFVNQISFGGPFQATNNCSGVIAAGASCTVSVVFAPGSSQSGAYAALLTIGGDFTATPASVSLSGTAITSAGTLSPTALTFVSQNVGTTSAAQILTLFNTGNGAINLSGIQATGDFAQTNNCGMSVAPGTSCSISVTFTPTAHGARSGMITVSGDFTSAAPSATLSGNGTTPTASLSPASLSFANQLVGSTSGGQGVTLTNSGDGPLTISAIPTTGDFAQTNNCGAALNPGVSCTITVTFAPSATGARSGTLALTSNSSVAVSPITLSGTGVAPVASLSPTTLTFANQLVNTSSTAQTVTLSNPGTAPLVINSIGVTGDFSETNTCGPSLAAGSSCTINVRFTPTGVSARNGVLTVSSNASGQAPTVALAGTGVAPDASLSASALTFSAQLIFTSSQQSVTLTNSGSAQLNIASISATGDFSQTNSCSTFSLAPGASCTITVTFTPSTSGTRGGTLTITDDAVSGGTQAVSLSGTCVAPAAVLSPASLSFGNQLVNSSSPAQTATLSNPGTALLNINQIKLTGTYSQTNNCGTSVAPGASCSINVTFTPTSRGVSNGVLSVSTTAVGGGNLQVTLAGSGIGPVASMSASSLTFAAQLVNTTSTQQAVTLTNSGDSTLNVLGVFESGDFAQTNNCGSTVAPGASCTVNVTFTPTTTGTRSGTLTISCDAINGGAQVISVSGTGVAPGAVLSPGMLTFSSQLVATSSAAQTVTLSNPGTATLVMSSINVTGDFSQVNNCGSTLNAGSSCTINIVFAPTARGSRSGTLTVASNAPGASPTVSLSGTGIAPIASLSASSLTFPTQVVNTASPQQALTLSNTGDAVLTLSNIGTSGDFSQTNNCGVSLAAGSSCTINVTFTATTAGARSGALIVNDNSLAGSQQTASLSGTGIDFSLSASPSSATVTAGHAAHYTVTVSPLGGSFGSSVSLSCSGLPADSACSFSPAAPTPGSGSVTSALTLTTTTRRSHSGTPAGTYTITISGTSGSRVQTVTVQLVVN